ncbi:MAG: ZIP family metal transporter [Candidatus Aenigmarchaeota archaeon]|nr:ZIP family metal transporter [Candidatus Aenigmarchaeota archaeon]
MDLLAIVAVCILGPVIGSLIGVLKKPSDFMVYNLLSFAAGVMISISFLDLIPESIELSSIWTCAAGLALGTAVMILVDKVVPHIHPSICAGGSKDLELKKTVYYLFLGIFLHNFPEGLAMGIVSASDFKLSFAIAVAIAIHDIPEAICTSAPYYKVNGNRLKAFLVSVSTIIPTLIGLFAAHYLSSYFPLDVVGLLIGAAAGLMIYISVDELIPSSCCRVSGYGTLVSFVVGVLLVIALGAL